MRICNIIAPPSCKVSADRNLHVLRPLLVILFYRTDTYHLLRWHGRIWQFSMPLWLFLIAAHLLTSIHKSYVQMHIQAM